MKIQTMLWTIISLTMLKKCLGNHSKMAITGVLLLFSACQDNLTVEVSPNPNEELINQSVLELNITKDQMASKVALNLAKSLGDLEIRDFVKKNAIKQFDGDYNFLVEVSKEDPVSVSKNGRVASLNFGDVISGTSSNSSARTSESSFLDSISSIYPLLQIAVPSLENENAETWETQSQIPLVAFVPTNHEESGTIPAYDLEGNQYHLSTMEEPEQLVIVISENERLMVFQKESSNSNGRTQRKSPSIYDCYIMQEPYYENHRNLYYLRSNVFEEINGCTGGGGRTGGTVRGSSTTTTCDRDRKPGKDRLHRLKFNSMSAFRRSADGWFEGGREIEVTAFFASADGGISKVTKFYFGRRRDFRDCNWVGRCKPEWFGLGNAEIVTWNKDTYGDRMLYVWVEKDGGSTSEFSTNLASTYEDKSSGQKNTLTTQVKVTIQADDDRLGESIVEYCDNTDGNGYSYNTGTLTFQVRQ